MTFDDSQVGLLRRLLRLCSGYALYKQHVFDEFKVAARDAVLDAIRRERQKEVQDRDLLKDAIAVSFGWLDDYCRRQLTKTSSGWGAN